MNSAKQLQRLINLVRAKLEADNIDIDDYDRAIKCLSNTVSPKLCIKIYEQYINF